MKKSNTPNPLKYFNDERAKRVAKLTKAQDGTTIIPTPDNMKGLMIMEMPTYDRNYKSKKDIRREKISEIKDKVKDVASNIKNKITGQRSQKTITSPMFKKGGAVKKKEGGPTNEYSKKITAGEKQGWKVDQPGAYKAGLTDTSSVTYLRKGKEFAGVKKPKK